MSRTQICTECFLSLRMMPSVLMLTMVILSGSLAKPYYSSSSGDCAPCVSGYGGSGYSSGGSSGSSYSSMSSSGYSSSSSSSFGSGGATGGVILPVIPSQHSVSFDHHLQHQGLSSEKIKQTFEQLKHQADAFVSKSKDTVDIGVPSPAIVSVPAVVPPFPIPVGSVSSHSVSGGGGSYHKEQYSSSSSLGSVGQQQQVSYGVPVVQKPISSGVVITDYTPSGIIAESHKIEQEQSKKVAITGPTYDVGSPAVVVPVSKQYPDVSDYFQPKDKYQQSSVGSDIAAQAKPGTFTYGVIDVGSAHSSVVGTPIAAQQQVPIVAVAPSSSYKKQQSGSSSSSVIYSGGDSGSPIVQSSIPTTGTGGEQQYITYGKTVPIITKVTYTQPAVSSYLTDSAGQSSSSQVLQPIASAPVGVSPIAGSSSYSSRKEESKSVSSQTYSAGGFPAPETVFVKPEKVKYVETYGGQPTAGYQSIGDYGGSSYSSGGGSSSYLSGGSGSGSSSYHSGGSGSLGGYVSHIDTAPIETEVLKSGSGGLYSSYGRSEYAQGFHSSSGHFSSSDVGLSSLGSYGGGAPVHKTYGVATSFSRKSQDINGEKSENRHAAVSINDNGRIETYEKSSK